MDGQRRRGGVVRRRQHRGGSGRIDEAAGVVCLVAAVGVGVPGRHHHRLSFYSILLGLPGPDDRRTHSITS